MVKAVKEAVKSGEIDVRADSALNYGKVTAKKIDNSYLLRVPYASGDIHEMSGLSVNLNEDAEIFSTSETIIKETAETYEVLAYAGDESVSKTIVKDDYNNNGEISILGLDDVNDCLDDYGVSRALLAAVAAGCGFICIGTIGTGCLACYGSYLAVDGGIIAGCLLQF